MEHEKGSSLDSGRKEKIVEIKTITEEKEKIKTKLAKVKHKIAVLSGKGGVGKSVVTANLATALASHARFIGILDADFHGPSIPKILGVRGNMLSSGPTGIFPVIGPLNMKIVSFDFLLPQDETPLIWRGPLKMNALRQLLSQIVWGSLDYLLIDLPPGTGDEPLSIAQLIHGLDGVIIVTIPSEVSQVVVKRSIGFTKRLNLSVIGVIENMAGFICPKCGSKYDIFGSGGGRKIAEELKVPFLGSIPLDPRISQCSDSGVPFIVEDPDSEATKSFNEIVDKIIEKVEGES